MAPAAASFSAQSWPFLGVGELRCFRQFGLHGVEMTDPAGGHIEAQSAPLGRAAKRGAVGSVSFDVEIGVTQRCRIPLCGLYTAVRQAHKLVQFNFVLQPVGETTNLGLDVYSAQVHARPAQLGLRIVGRFGAQIGVANDVVVGIHKVEKQFFQIGAAEAAGITGAEVERFAYLLAQVKRGHHGSVVAAVPTAPQAGFEGQAAVGPIAQAGQHSEVEHFAATGYLAQRIADSLTHAGVMTAVETRHPLPAALFVAGGQHRAEHPAGKPRRILLAGYRRGLRAFEVGAQGFFFPVEKIDPQGVVPVQRFTNRAFVQQCKIAATGVVKIVECVRLVLRPAHGAEVVDMFFKERTFEPDHLICPGVEADGCVGIMLLFGIPELVATACARVETGKIVVATAGEQQHPRRDPPACARADAAFAQGFVLAVQAEAPAFELGAAADQVYDPRQRVGAVVHGSGALDQFHPFDIGQADLSQIDIAILPPDDRHAVDQDFDILPRHALY